MSELINNSEYRKNKLKELIKSLHEGRDFEEVKEQFQKEFGTVSTEEISELEKALVKEGLPIEEIQRLCDVHAAVFEGSVEDIHKRQNEGIVGHPINVMIEENKAIEKVVNEEILPYLESYMEKEDKTSMLMLRVGLDRLWEVDIHYSRKENLMFPYLEKHGVTAPPRVMWGVDDEIRADIKELIKITSQPQVDKDELYTKVINTTKKVLDMISKENNILIPLLNDTLTFYEWIKIDEATPEIGYCLVTPKKPWKVEETEEEVEQEEIVATHQNEVEFDAGRMTPEEINALLNTVPLDMTFVDKHNNVRYFTQGKERIFARPKTILGRNVSMCHPPASVHVVDQIINSFKSGEKDHEDFWIQLGDKFVLIRYFAVRNNLGEYLGTLEVTQDIKPLRELQGEKRLIE
ncbi:MAG TPA: DUF438 domain-containing protein [Acholeplasmataceae bacterium]|nr:DUF438 domain-containing protein [Acholeplasmataceae bacterium]